MADVTPNRQHRSAGPAPGQRRAMAGGVHHVAQMNWGLLRAPWGDPAVAGFTDHLDAVNAIAERTSGFVWRLQDVDAALTAENDPSGGHWQDQRLALTMSVWESAAALAHFVQNTLHGAFLRRRQEWFQALDRRTYVIWPVPAGHRPGLAEARERLAMLARDGASALAYDFEFLGKMAAPARAEAE